MERPDRRTLRDGAIGGLVGTALGLVPLVALVAPLLGGGLAGGLARGGPRRGALAGAVAGVVLVVLDGLVSTGLLLARFGELPGAGLSPEALLFTTALSLLAGLGAVVAAAVGGALAGLLVEARGASALDVGPATPLATSMSPTSRAAIALGSLLAGAVAFGAVALALTAALDPFIWPSALVGLPVGVLAGAAVAVLGYAYLMRGPRSGRDWRRIGAAAVAVAVVFALVVAGLLVLGGDRLDATTESTYTYEVVLSADRSLEDPTFYVPVPVENGTSAIGERFVAEVEYSRDRPVIEGDDAEPAPVAFTYELVETEHGPMLAISADRLEVTQVYYRRVENETMGWYERIDPGAYDPDDPTMGVQHDGSFTFAVSLAAAEEVDTADPFDDEPLLTRAGALREVDCGRPGASSRCFAYVSPGYAAYATDPATTVYVRASLEGRNEWFSGGWSGNDYRAWHDVELVGPQEGWHATTAELEVGSGRYR